MAALYTLLYIAPAEEAEALALADHPVREWPGAWIQHLGDLELVALWKAVAPAEAGFTLMGDLAFQASEAGPFVIRVPDEFVSTMAALDDARLSSVATAWAEAEELGRRRHAEELVGVVTQLRDLARQAVASGHPVLQVAEI